MTRRHDGTLPEHDARLATCRRAVVQRIVRITRQVLGAPDYDAYLDHCRVAGHPPQLTERQFVAEFFESRGKSVHCC